MSSTPARVKALYAYEDQETGLKISPGTVIDVTGERSDEWYEGSHGGHSGLIPKSYVEALPGDEIDGAPIDDGAVRIELKETEEKLLSDITVLKGDVAKLKDIPEIQGQLLVQYQALRRDVTKMKESVLELSESQKDETELWKEIEALKGNTRNAKEEETQNAELASLKAEVEALKKGARDDKEEETQNAELAALKAEVEALKRARAATVTGGDVKAQLQHDLTEQAGALAKTFELELGVLRHELADHRAGQATRLDDQGEAVRALQAEVSKLQTELIGAVARTQPQTPQTPQEEGRALPAAAAPATPVAGAGAGDASLMRDLSQLTKYMKVVVEKGIDPHRQQQVSTIGVDFKGAADTSAEAPGPVGVDAVASEPISVHDVPSSAAAHADEEMRRLEVQLNAAQQELVERRTEWSAQQAELEAQVAQLTKAHEASAAAAAAGGSAERIQELETTVEELKAQRYEQADELRQLREALDKAGGAVVERPPLGYAGAVGVLDIAPEPKKTLDVAGGVSEYDIAPTDAREDLAVTAQPASEFDVAPVEPGEPADVAAASAAAVATDLIEVLRGCIYEKADQERATAVRLNLDSLVKALEQRRPYDETSKLYVDTCRHQLGKIEEERKQADSDLHIEVRDSRLLLEDSKEEVARLYEKISAHDDETEKKGQTPAEVEAVTPRKVTDPATLTFRERLALFKAKETDTP